MELRHLRYFVTVAELGSLSRASAALFIAQPPLSKQIKDLEEEVGAALLIRNARGVALTAVGEAFLKEARATLDQAERAKRVARQFGASEGGLLTIGFIPSATRVILPRLLRQLKTRRPSAEVEVREMLTLEQTEALQTGAIDLGIGRPPVAGSRLTIAAELDDPFCLAIPKGHRLAMNDEFHLVDARDEHFVTYMRDQARAYFDQTLNFCGEAGFVPNVRCQASSTYAVIDLVSAGVGVSIVPSSAATFSDDAVVFRKLVRPQRPGCIGLIQRKIDLNPLVADAVGLMHEIFRDMQIEIRRRTF
jgi:DNA-binding transcriptional LysR family regulator